MLRQHKKLMIFGGIVVFALAAYLAYYFPIQRFCCEKKFYQYIAEQGIQPEDIETIRYYKDYTQDGYYIDVQYKSDPDFRYCYHYYLVTRTRSSGIKCDVMSLIGYNNENQSVENEDLKYPPL